MTRQDIRNSVLRAINDPNAVFFPTSDANEVIEEAQEFMAEFGTPVTRRVLVPTRAQRTYYRLSIYAVDAMMPVRIYSAANTRVLDVRSLDWLDAYDVDWEATTGSPHLWFPRGWDQFGIFPKPASDGGILRVDYLAWPQALLHDGATPEFADVDHEALILYTLCDAFLRGGQITDAMSAWKQLMVVIGQGRWTRENTTPDRIHQHGRGNGDGRRDSG